MELLRGIFCGKYIKKALPRFGKRGVPYAYQKKVIL